MCSGTHFGPRCSGKDDGGEAEGAKQRGSSIGQERSQRQRVLRCIVIRIILEYSYCIVTCRQSIGPNKAGYYFQLPNMLYRTLRSPHRIVPELKAMHFYAVNCSYQIITVGLTRIRDDYSEFRLVGRENVFGIERQIV